ncbi:MAG: bifunctional nicotinamidase/pyrazinamidase [Inquilinaceae bacterium]
MPADAVTIADTDMLLVIDVQNDFCPGGGLPIVEGDRVVPVINRLAGVFDHIVATQDWHPAGHSSFASSHPGRAPMETIAMPYGDQILWPDHCIQGTDGAAFHRDLDLTRAELVLRKGFRRDIDSYSAFRENDKSTETGLAGYLKERGFRRIFAVGLALDVCVRYSAEDAVDAGFDVIVIEDACRAVDHDGSRQAALQAFADRRVGVIDSRAVTGRG